MLREAGEAIPKATPIATRWAFKHLMCESDRAMHPKHTEKKYDDKVPTIDERTGEPVQEVNAPTRMVQPHRDHGVERPMAKPTSTAKMAAMTRPLEDMNAVRGILAEAVLDDGSFIIRLTQASASMHALMQIGLSKGEEIEIVIRRRMV